MRRGYPRQKPLRSALLRRWIPENGQFPLDSVGKSIRISQFAQNTILSTHQYFTWSMRTVGADNWQANVQRFHKYCRQSFVIRRQHEEISLRHQSSGISAKPSESHSIRDAQTFSLPLQVAQKFAVANNHELGVNVADNNGKGFQEECLIFLGLEAADIY